MFGLHLPTILALALFAEVAVSHNVYYRHRHVRPSGSYARRRGHSTPYGTRGVASLLGKPVLPNSANNGRPQVGHIHPVGTKPQLTFGASRVPVSSFAVPGSAGVTGLPGTPVTAPHPTPGAVVISNPTLGITVSPSSTLVTGNIPGFPNSAVSGSGNQITGSSVAEGSVLDNVDIRVAIPEAGATESTRGGSCPPVRASCTTFRTSPPSCEIDDTCIQGQKCCFDTCVQKNICKSVI